MASDEKIMEGGGEGTSHDTPQAITITIMAPSALETTTIDSALVASVEAQDARQASDSLLVVPTEGDGSTISVTHGAKNLLQTVTETHMGSEDLPVISNINSSEDTTEESTTIQFVNKSEKLDDLECEEGDNLLGCHCLICNEELESEQFPVFKSVTTTSQRKVSVFLGILVGQKLTSRKAHSSIICEKCFNLLNKLDLLEVQIRQTKDEIVHKYQETVAAYGGRARRKKPAAAKKSDYVFPKIEPEDEDQQALALEMDETFEPLADDLIEEEQDRREDRDSQDEEWEPEFKRARIKREPSNADPSGAPKRKRGRPRKDASKPKTLEDDQIAEIDDTRKELCGENRLSRPGAVKTRSCVYCEEDVPVLQLMSHMDTHERQQFSCPFCSHALPRMSLCRHIQEQHAEWLDECDICNIKFISSPSFKKHYESHHSGEYVCAGCDLKFGTAIELLNHSNTKHYSKSDEKYECPCGKVYFHRSKYVTHVVKFHRGQVEIDGLVWGVRGNLVCRVCRKKFKKASLYIAHERVHRNKRVYCPHCPSNYPSVSLLQDHVLTHQFGDYECDKCNMKFASIQQLNIHEEKVHNIEISKECEFCNRVFSERINLICHRRKEHPESIEYRKAKYSCGKCDMKFLIRGNLVRHLKVHEREKNEKPHECGYCGKILSSKYSLATHVKSHSRGGDYKCSICDKLFVSKYTLLDHIRRIHDEFGYGRDKVCKQCGRSFFKKSELDYHMKTHTGERPYRCGVCGETYLSTSTLRYHMQKHSNTMYVCQVCSAKFKNYVGWSAHVKRVHGVTSIREYTKEHGILQAVVEKDTPPLYIVAPGNARSAESGRNVVQKDVISDSLNSTSLAVGLEETVVSMPGKEVDNIVHVVSYDDLANPLVHTVNAAEVALPNSNQAKASISQPSLSFSSEVMKNGGDTSYSQTSDRGRVMISEGWELILSEENEESQVVVAEEWESAHIIVPETGEEQHMVLSNEWDGTQGMTELVVKEEGQGTHVMSSWKDCVDYE